MARINLVPQNRVFYELYGRASHNVVAIAEKLVALLDAFPEGADSSFREIRELEHEGDRVTHDVVDHLNRTFVTPFDRDDMYRLSGALDDICDHVDEAAGNIVSYGIERVRPKAREQAGVILRAATKLDEAVGFLDGFKDARRQLIELRELEDEGDRLLREAVSELFASNEEPLVVIRWKDIHERLEEAVDSCEQAAHVLESAYLKNK